ncbi:hypothetical protein RN001_001120 [Aquatica leii]|uniref:Uncharacterized protein n=1 Tax=Aquatica leii TaxID=1421715 RepID=A0AAN7SL12_9COLE|nr:hypothetical protein RN001_001120 [Aquatica leii]
MVIFNKYRILAIVNDKKLKDEYGQTYLAPITDAHEIIRLFKEVTERDYNGILLNNVSLLNTNLKAKKHYDNDTVKTNSDLNILLTDKINHENLTSSSTNTLKNYNLPTTNKGKFTQNTNFNAYSEFSHMRLKKYTDKIANLNKRTTQFNKEVQDVLRGDKILIKRGNECKNIPLENIKKSISIPSSSNIQNPVLQTIISNITPKKQEMSEQAKPKNKYVKRNENIRRFKQTRLDGFIKSLQVKTQNSSMFYKENSTLPNVLMSKDYQSNLKRVTPKLNVLSHHVISNSAITEVTTSKHTTEKSVTRSSKSTNSRTRMHPYIKKLLNEDKSLVIPKKLYGLNIKPKVFLDKNAVIDWYITQVDSLTKQLDSRSHQCSDLKYFLRKRKFKRIYNEDTDSDSNSDKDFSTGSGDNYEDEDGNDENIKSQIHKKCKKTTVYNNLGNNTIHYINDNNTIKNTGTFGNKNTLLHIFPNKEKVIPNLRTKQLFYNNDSSCYNKNLRSHLTMHNLPFTLENSSINNTDFLSNAESIQNNVKNFGNDFSNRLMTISQNKSALLNLSTLPPMVETQQMYTKNALYNNFENQQCKLLMQEIDFNIQKLQKNNPPSYEEWLNQCRAKSKIVAASKNMFNNLIKRVIINENLIKATHDSLHEVHRRVDNLLLNRIPDSTVGKSNELKEFKKKSPPITTDTKVQEVEIIIKQSATLQEELRFVI